LFFKPQDTKKSGHGERAGGVNPEGGMLMKVKWKPKKVKQGFLVGDSGSRGMNLPFFGLIFYESPDSFVRRSGEISNK